MPKYIIQVQLGEGADAPWEPVLEVPITDVRHFSSKPFKWLRYVTAVIFGAEGHLHIEDGDVVNYDDPAPVLRVLRYHPSAVFKLIDPQGLDHLTSQSSTGSQAGFRQALIDRDGICVISGEDPMFCTASHLIPKFKGDKYIEGVFQWRAAPNDILMTSITDIRNGLLLGQTLDVLHSNLKMAAIRTPNFALETNDILPLQLDVTPLRFTVNAFTLVTPLTFTQRDMRIPCLIEGWPQNWPPKWLWDFVYGVVCAKHYGLPNLSNWLKEHADQTYYPEGVKIAQDRIRRDILQAEQVKDAKQSKQSSGRANCFNRCGGSALEGVDMYDLVLNLWMATRSTPWGKEQVVKHYEETQETEKFAQERAHQESVNRVAQWLGHS